MPDDALLSEADSAPTSKGWAERHPKKLTMNPTLMRAFKMIDNFTLDMDAMHDEMMAQMYGEEKDAA